MDKDTEYMKTALSLAAKGAGTVSPNPMVGCVVVKNDAIVGTGWHQKPGGPHAEIVALHDAGQKARGAIAYVTLEPCSHHGRTGPCCDALIDAGVREVVYAMADPNPVASKGAERLKSAGIKVRSGIGEAVAQHLNRAWLHALEHKRPYVTGKIAMSLDGRICTRSGESQWITSEFSRARAHELRFATDAILTGAGTVIADNPALTARVQDEIRQPLRIVLDSTGRTSPKAKVYDRAGRGAIIATAGLIAKNKAEEFEKVGVEILSAPPSTSGRTDLAGLLRALHARDVVNLMVEGGGEVMGAFFDADLIDELYVFVAPKLLGGGKNPFAGEGVRTLNDAGRFEFSPPEMLGPDHLLHGMRRKHRP